MLIYKATNRVNGKEYVGQTVYSLERRKNKHISDALNNRDTCYFHSAIRKYGIKNFEWKTLDSARNIEELNELEIFFINLFKTFENGYNLTEGGRGNSGFKHSAETKQKISEAGKGKKHSVETKRKISEAQIGEKNHNYGKKASVETRKKISKSLEGRVGKYNAAAKAVSINGKYFDTRKEAAEFVGITPAGVRLRILHKTKWLDYKYIEK